MNSIKEHRLRAGLTLEQLANAVGTSFQQIQRLETNARKLNTIWMERLAPFLNCRPQDLMITGVVNIPSVGDRISDPLEAVVITFWRKMDIAHKEFVLRAMAPPGFVIPTVDDTAGGRKQN